MLFLQRSHRRYRNNARHSQVFEAIYIRAEVQFGGKNAVPASMTGEKSNLMARKRSENVRVRGIAERSFLFDFLYVAEAGHRIEPAATDDSDVRFRQPPSIPLRNVEPN